MGIFGTALGQAQKLFDRGLAVVGLLPCLVFSAVLLVLMYGSSSVSILTRNYGPKNEDGPILIFLTVVGLYLAAYILYGLRGLLYSLHCGGWSRLLGGSVLTRLLISQQRAHGRLIAAYKRQDSPLEIAYWAGAGDPDLKYRPIWTPDTLSLADVRAALAGFDRAHDIVHPALERPGGLSIAEERRLWEMVGHAARLHGQLGRLRGENADPASSAERGDLARRIEGVVRMVKEDAASFPAFARYIDDMAVVYCGERDLYFETLTAIYPLKGVSGTMGRVRPTRLGNIALRAELYTQDRYKIVLEELWPRLEMVMSDEIKKQVEDSRQLLDFAVVMTALSGVAALFQIGHAASRLYLELHFTRRISHHAAPLFPVSAEHWLLMGVGLLVCVVAVRAFDEVAVQAARGYGARLCSAVDLCRLDLLKSLSIPAPKTRAEETDLWEQLSAFIREAEPLKNVGYRPEPAEPRTAKRTKKPEDAAEPDAGMEKSEAVAETGAEKEEGEKPKEKEDAERAKEEEKEGGEHSSESL